MSDWKKINRPSVCTTSPIEHLIPKEIKYETTRKIKEECLDHYNKDIISECSKRKVCISKSCLGRELPWKSKTAKPYLEELRKTQKIQNELLYIKPNCKSCSIVKSCKSTCDQITDYIKRDKSIEPQVVSKLHYDKFINNIFDNSNKSDFKAVIPWDILSDRRRKVIKMYLYERRDFKYIANKLNLNNQSRAKYEYYAALTTVSEYVTMREFLNNNLQKLTEKQKNVISKVYYENKNLCEVAENLKVSKQAIQQMIARVVKKFKIVWPKFVWKSGNKVVYNVPKILK